MDLGLNGKVAIVTGGSKGIGSATAMAQGQEGVDVCICARGVEDLKEAVAKIPIGRMVEPEDTADLVLFLVSGRFGAINGQTIAVEGGAGRGVFY